MRKIRIVCWLLKMPEISLQRQQIVLTAIATDQDLVYCRYSQVFKRPKIQEYTRSDPNRAVNIKQPNSLLACLS